MLITYINLIFKIVLSLMVIPIYGGEVYEFPIKKIEVCGLMHQLTLIKF